MAETIIAPKATSTKPCGQIHEPVIQVDGSLGTYYVNVRPCPPFLPSYHGIEAALVRAGYLSERYGWKVAVICDETDGAA